MAKLTKPQTTGVMHKGLLLSEFLDNLVSKRSLVFKNVIPHEDTKLEIELDATWNVEVLCTPIVGLSAPALCTIWTIKVSDTNIEVHVLTDSPDPVTVEVDIYMLRKQPVSA